MEFKPDRSKRKPIYKQIAEFLEKEISSGEISPSDPLPSERSLAKKLSVNRSTIIAAYDELQAIGIVIRKKGSGTHINTDIWGISHNRIPNWGRYVEDGSFLPNLPLVQKLRSEIQSDEVINMASGELAPDLFPSDELSSIFTSHSFNGHYGYDHPQGNKGLRETISKHVEHYKNICVHPNSILITSGAQQALHLIVQCLLKPGDTVAIEDPSYTFSLPIFQSAGIRTLLLPVDKYGVNPEDIIAIQKKHRIRMLFLNPDHQNPTGTKMPIKRRKRILELSTEYGIPVIEDDPYSLTSFNGDIGPSIKSMDDNGNVVYISSLSKIVASGLRIGWIIGPRKVIERLADAKQQVDFGHSIFPQWVANEFLISPQFDTHIRRLRKSLKDRRDIMISALVNLPEVKMDNLVPEGGIHLWLKLTTQIDEFKFLEEAMKKGVAFVPGRIFGTEKGYIRLTYGRVDKHLIEEGIYRFSSTLKNLTSGNQ